MSGAEYDAERPGFSEGREVVQESHTSAYESRLQPPLEAEFENDPFFEGSSNDPQSRQNALEVEEQRTGFGFLANIFGEQSAVY